MRNILVTGASGFVGTELCRALARHGAMVRRALHRPYAGAAAGDVVVGELGAETAWAKALQDVEAVVHLAAHTHAMHAATADSLAAYRRINVVGTETLALAACAAGARRIVYVSSVKVNGEITHGKPFDATDPPRPQDAYGVSKWEAEQALWRVATAKALEAVVLRPPLLYGPGVKGNFLRLMRAVEAGVPLPFGSVQNRRSLLYLGNLIDAILLCLERPQAAGGTYLVADDEGISTPDLIRAIARALGKPAWLVPFPPVLLKAAGAMVGKSDAVARLLGSLQVDSGRIRRDLGWQPPYTMAEGLGQTAQWYHQRLESAAPT